MANERIDVKAEAREIAERNLEPIPKAVRYGEYSLADNIEDWAGDIIALATRVRAEAIRETVDTISPMICLGCRSTSYYLGVDGYHRHKDGEAPSFRCATLDIRAAFAEPGKEQEPRDIGKAAIAYLKEMNLLQFVDAAVELAGYAPTHDRVGCSCPGCTILRLAPQFMEKP